MRHIPAQLLYQNTELPYYERIFEAVTSSCCLSYSSHLPSATRDLRLLLSTAQFHLLTEVLASPPCLTLSEQYLP